MNSSFTTKYGEIEHPNRPSQCQHYEMVDYQKANNFQTCSQWMLLYLFSNYRLSHQITFLHQNNFFQYQLLLYATGIKTKQKNLF